MKHLALVLLCVSLTGCVTGNAEWTDADRHLTPSERANMNRSYQLCLERSWNDAVLAADKTVPPRELLDGQDTLFWLIDATGNGLLWLGRGFSRSIIIADVRDYYMDLCMHEAGWYLEEGFSTTVTKR